MSNNEDKPKENSLISNTQMIKDVKDSNEIIKSQNESAPLSSSRQFSYLYQTKNSTCFKYNISNSTGDIFEIKNKYNLCFCITVPSDTVDCSAQLKLSIDSIYQNINQLHDLGIKPNKVLFCLFIKEILRIVNGSIRILWHIFHIKCSYTEHLSGSLTVTSCNQRCMHINESSLLEEFMDCICCQ